MRPIDRLLNVWTQPDFWSVPGHQVTSVIRSGERESIPNDFQSYVDAAYKANGIVFTCILVRMLIFSEARFQWRERINGRSGELFDTEALSILDRPWPNGTTGELLSRMEQNTSLAGNFFATTVGAGPARRVRVLRPDWMTVVTGTPNGDPNDLMAEVIGYYYEPKGPQSNQKPTLLKVDDVVHWSPIPDPTAQWRGMSWLTPVIDEVNADKSATKHKLKFFENGAIPGLAVSYDASLGVDDFGAFVKSFNEQHQGIDNAYKTLHLGGGADPKVIGADLKQIDFKVSQGGGETRVAAASGVGAVIAQFSEGMQGSSLNSGNYSASRRRVADGTIRPLWRSAAAALEKLAGKPPSNAHLWYDARDVPFLRDDASEEAEIRNRDALTLESLIRAGFTAESATKAVTSGNFTVLEHTGLTSVQLQPPQIADREETNVRS